MAPKPPPPSALSPFIFEPISATTKAHFDGIPWTRHYTSDPTLQPYTTAARIPKVDSTADTFCAITLNSKDTVTVWQSWWKPAPASTPSSSDDKEVEKKFGESIALLSFSSGLNGHPDTIHGGFLGVILDELIGNAAEYERPHDKSTMTAYLKVDYKRPVATPGTLAVKTWVEKVQGRKIWGRGEVFDKEGKVCATGEALFIVVERVKGAGDGSKL
ncbi:HotDog domain-containing protein [Cadophora sp. MPI-SDFR-AT-0126]|nr:HotDog domain-containing protein [Leotiomycetes sp. MPI-SDFR-AT-0126]